MEIRRIQLRHFKRFSEIDIAFSPGLNIVKGPNEAGKSSLHESIVVALMERPTGKKSEYKYQSWNQDRLYEVELSYLLPSDETVTIHKDFQACTHEVHGANGADPSRSGLNAAIKRAVGTTSEKLFSSTACIRQDSMMDLHKGGKEISTQLQEIAMGGVMDVNQIIDRLQEKVIEFERGWKTHAPRNPGPIRQLKNQMNELAQKTGRLGSEVEGREKAQNELFHHRERTALLQKESELLKRLCESYTLRRDLLEDFNKHAQLEGELEKRIERIEGVEKRKEHVQKRLDKLKPFISVDEHTEKELQAARGAWKDKVAEVNDRKRRAIELEQRYEQRRKIRLGKAVYWMVGLILFGIAMGFVGSLSAGYIENVYRTTSLVIGGVITLVGILWGLFEFIHQRSTAIHLRNQFREARERYELSRVTSAKAEMELKTLLEPLGCEMWEEFEIGLERCQKLGRDLTMLKDMLAALLDTNDSRHDLENQRREISRRRRDTQEQLDVLDETPELTAVEYQKLIHELGDLEAEIRDRSQKIIRLETIVDSGREAVENLYRSMERKADLQVRLEHALERHQILKLALQGLREVRDHILETAQNELEPRLGMYLARLTNGRYLHAHVDENLQVRVLLNSKDNRLLGVEEMSSGTRDQVYLAARLALCDMIFHDAKPPLLMDDPFIKFDPKRREAALRLCKELSRERQIILFTCHDGYDAFADRIIMLD